MSLEEKELKDVYRQRGEAWLMAMAFAKLAGCEVGVRENDGEWPVHVIVLPSGKEVALHMAMADAEGCVLGHETKREWDNHDNAEKEKRIRAFVRSVFGDKESLDAPQAVEDGAADA